MATTPKSGNLIKLYLREAGSTASYKYVVCNEDLALEGTSDEISRPTKCGTLKTAGTPSYTIPLSGVANFTLDADQLSHNELSDWFATQQSLEFVLSDAATGGTIINYSGNGVLTDFSLQLPVDDMIGFTGTLAVNGTPVNGI